VISNFATVRTFDRYFFGALCIKKFLALQTKPERFYIDKLFMHFKCIMAFLARVRFITAFKYD
jgi:hypothetical protein